MSERRIPAATVVFFDLVEGQVEDFEPVVEILRERLADRVGPDAVISLALREVAEALREVFEQDQHAPAAPAAPAKDPICDFSDLPVGGCGHCHPPEVDDEPDWGAGVAKTQRQARTPAWSAGAYGEEPDLPRTDASFATSCPGCGNEMVEGDRIYLVAGEWSCRDCAEAAR